MLSLKIIFGVILFLLISLAMSSFNLFVSFRLRVVWAGSHLRNCRLDGDVSLNPLRWAVFRFIQPVACFPKPPSAPCLKTLIKLSIREACADPAAVNTEMQKPDALMSNLHILQIHAF